MAGLNFYDLQPLALSKEYYSFTDGNDEYKISFCQDLPTAQRCADHQDGTMVVGTISNECKTLSGADPTKDSLFEVLNSDGDDGDGLKIKYSGGTGICDSASGKLYTFEVDITCSSKEGEPTGTIETVETCQKILKFEHKVGCKYD
jgi:hypothetical protein